MRHTFHVSVTVSLRDHHYDWACMTNPDYDREVDPDAPNESRAMSLRLVGTSKRVLEFGCSTGRVTAALAKRGCRVTGIDIDAEAAERARPYADEIVILDLDEADFETKLADQRWEVALFGDVLEHLRDPLRTLRAARQLLDAHGELVVSVPNVAHADVRLALLRGEFPYGSSGLLDRTHLRFFTLSSLTSLLEDAGYLIVDVLRIVIPVFGSEIALPREEFSPAVIETLLSDPEAESYQYVVRAVPDNGDATTRDLGERCVRLETELHHTKVRYELELCGALDRMLSLEAELKAIKNGRLMRYSAPLRWIYRQVRAGYSIES
jgi:2-polyprenyl-3-methyl-5-hydroxy-6-metoxy-1,4-benzoquinol methylase